jgi:hypothetical protein
VGSSQRVRSDLTVLASSPENWRKLSASSTYRVIESLLKDYRWRHKYSKEDFFVCSDMAIEIWDILKTTGINAKLLVGNVDRDIVRYDSPHEYIAKMNHIWVMAEVMPAEWVPVEATVGQIVHPQVPNFLLYHKGTLFENPKRFKEFNESRNAVFETCKEAHKAANHYNDSYAGKLATRESLEHSGRVKQKVEDCKNLEEKVMSFLKH